MTRQPGAVGVVVAVRDSLVGAPGRHTRGQGEIAMLRRLLIAGLLGSSVAAPATAQQPPADLGGATLEELMNIHITTAGRREQAEVDTAAAVFVITSEYIRRSGLSSMPELLRLVPGVQ